MDVLNSVIHGDVLGHMHRIADGSVQCVIADPPYYNVLLNEQWDTEWSSVEEYLDWSVQWLRAIRPKLRDDGLVYVFGQAGKREHAWIHLCSRFSLEMQFHDLLVWDRVVGYNDRKDSFTPQYENILVLRASESSKPFFDKDAVRVSYSREQIELYSRDKRYSDRDARMAHLEKGKYATNILRYPSLKGASNEKVGHPSQKPVSLIRALIRASTREGDLVFDPFLGSGTTAVAAIEIGRNWIGIEKSMDYVAMTNERLASSRSQCQLPLTFTNGKENR